jgi:hypothetical protein
MMKGHGAKFTRKMEAAIIGLLTQKNLEEAARYAGVSVATLLRWQKLPEFKKAYRVAQRTVHGQSMARLHQATSAAVSTVLKIMLDPNTSAATKVKAAATILGLSSKSLEEEEIEVRLAELEAAMEASQKGR